MGETVLLLAKELAIAIVSDFLRGRILGAEWRPRTMIPRALVLPLACFFVLWVARARWLLADGAWDVAIYGSVVVVALGPWLVPRRGNPRSWTVPLAAPAIGILILVDGRLARDVYLRCPSSPVGSFAEFGGRVRDTHQHLYMLVLPLGNPDRYAQPVTRVADGGAWHQSVRFAGPAGSEYDVMMLVSPVPLSVASGVLQGPIPGEVRRSSVCHATKAAG